MNLKKEPISELYLSETKVENIFINEYMTNAPGDYVKVYLFGLMCAEQNLGSDTAEIARQCAMDEEDVLKAWTYWESRGLVRKHFPRPENRFIYDLSFQNLREQLYCPEVAFQEDEARQREMDLNFRNFMLLLKEFLGGFLEGRSLQKFCLGLWIWGQKLKPL